MNTLRRTITHIPILGWLSLGVMVGVAAMTSALRRLALMLPAVGHVTSPAAQTPPAERPTPGIPSLPTRRPTHRLRDQFEPVQRVMLSHAFGVLGVMFILLAAPLLLPTRPLATLVSLLPYLLPATLLLGVAWWFVPDAVVLIKPQRVTGEAGRVNWRYLLTGMLPMLLLIASNADVTDIERLNTLPHHIQFVLLVMSFILIVVGLIGTWRLWPSRRALINHANEIVIVMVIVFAALIIRVWSLHSVLPLYIDEVHFARASTSTRLSSDIPLILPFGSITAFPWLFPYLQSLFAAVFGQNLVGLRLISAVIGTLSIPAVYVLVRHLFDRRTALITALVFLSLPPHVHFSRLGLNNIADATFGVMALALFAAALHSGRRQHYVYAGLLLGVSQYFYEVGRLFYPALLGIWLLIVVVLWWRQVWWHGVRLMLTAALLTAAPLYLSWLAQGISLTPRLQARSIDSIPLRLLDSLYDPIIRSEMLGRFKASLLHYAQHGDTTFFWGNGQPLLLAALVPVMLAGLIFVILRLRSPGAWLLLLWTGGIAFGNGLASDVVASQRFIAVLPALAILVALGIRSGVPLLWPRHLSFSVERVTVIVALVLAVIQAHYYFNTHVPRYFLASIESSPHSEINDATFRAAQLPENTVFHIFSQVPLDGNVPIGILSYMSDHEFRLCVLDNDVVNAAYLAQMPQSANHAFFVEPWDTSIVDLIAEYWLLPTAPQRSTNTRIPEHKRFDLYFVPEWGRNIQTDISQLQDVNLLPENRLCLLLHELRQSSTPIGVGRFNDD